MTADRADWAAAYAKQSRSDFAIYALMSAEASGISACHRLHYLQMACEKIAKAYRFRDTSTASEDLLTSHVAFSKFIECFLTSPAMKQRYRGKDARLRNVIRYARKYARAVEELAPAVDRENTPCNAEYPWEDEHGVVVPCEYTYPGHGFLLSPRDPASVDFLKVVRTAIDDFESMAII